MEIKHTIEILTKDIQDIENLVRNLNNYTTPPRIELDLAMAKLRNVYELLAMISSDMKSEQQTEGNDSALIEKAAQPETKHIESKEEAVQVPLVEKANETEGLTKQEAVVEESQNERQVEVHPEENKDEEKEVHDPKAAEPILEFADLEEKQSPPQAEKKTDTPEVHAESQKEIFQQQEIPVREEYPGPQQTEIKAEEPKKASILAEKFEANASLNERIAPGKDKDLVSKFSGEPIDSIKRNIGINDRFLIIRELMGGDTEQFNEYIQKLDSCADSAECLNLIQAKFPGKHEHEGVKILTNLAKRRYIRN